MPPLASSGPEPVPIASGPMAQVPVAAAPRAAVTASAPGPASQTIGAGAGEVAISLDDRLKEVEANLITWALKMSGGNKSKAAELLRIKRSTLGDRINRCGLGRTVSTEVAV